MFSSAFRARKPPSEAERPFWISYADLMTAMMMLFLVAMAVTIVAPAINRVDEEQVRRQEISQICSKVKDSLVGRNSIAVDCDTNRITFPDAEVGFFQNREYKLPLKAHGVLAQLVPRILEAADTGLGPKWFRRVQVDGYASRTGTYLLNLNLSMNRSYWVMCLLADPEKNAELRLDEAQLLRVRELFRVGGASFNEPKESEEASRRVEFTMEFNARPFDKGDAQDTLRGAGGVGQDKCGLP